MVACTSRTLLRGKNCNDEPKKRQRSETSSTSSTSHSVHSAHSVSPVFYEEGSSIDNLVWPSRREDCAWVADKVRQPGDKLIWPSSRENCAWMSGKFREPESRAGWSKQAEVDYGVFRDEVVSYGVRPAYLSPDRTRRKHRLARRESPRMKKPRNTSPAAYADAERKAKRQPLRDITDANVNGASSSSSSAFRPERTIPSDWHQSLINFLNARKERDVANAVA